MKEDMMRRAIGGIDDKLIEGAEKEPKTSRMKTVILKWGSVAAAFALTATVAAFVLPGMLKANDPADVPDTPPLGESEGGTSEHKFEMGYTYSVDGGKYASYVGGRAIADKYVGEKLEDVTVTAGWVDSDGKKLTEEHARAEVYVITGVSTDVAVAVRFIDKLEAETTTQYYVIMDPTSDLTPVMPYVISNDPDYMNDGAEIAE